jgi:hypothetical protein
MRVDRGNTMDYINELIAALGLAWAAAVGLEFLSIVIEGAATPMSWAANLRRSSQTH